MDHILHGQLDKRLLGVVAGLVALFLLFRGNSRPVLSSWQGDAPPAAAAAGLSGTAAQVGHVGQGSTLVVPPGISPDQPWGNPVVAARVVLTQGYGSGTHAPAAVWGAIDLAVDSNGDGAADPTGSYGAPIRATMSGVVKVTPDSWPAGNHVWVLGERYKTGYAHLQTIEVQDGQYVERGTIIGTMGSTGMSSGPHLDYQIWYDGVNQNPLEYHPFP